MIVLGLYLVFGMATTFYVSWKHKIELEHSSAIRAAAAYSEAITSMRGFYAKQIVPRARESGMTLSHEYRKRTGVIPFPATMSIDMGLALGRAGEGTHYRLYSAYPFPWRGSHKMDGFERVALERLNRNPSEPVIRFDRKPSGKILRYATAVVMQADCLGCHNNSADSPKTDWRPGDVRGVQMVTVRIPDTRNFAFREMGMMAAISGIALLLMWILTTRLQRSLARSRELAALSDQHNAELVVAKSAAEKANAAKTQFLATMSHELRTPLNSIIGFAEVLRNADTNKQIQANVAEYANDIQTSGQHLLDLINDILDMSKIEAGMLDLQEETVSLTETVRTCLHLVAGRAEIQSVTLEDNIPEDLPPILGDRKAMRQIMLNLLSNAVKFTEPGGCVSVCAARHDDGIHIVVTDTGIGIPSEQLDEIFKPFTQADNSTARRHEGTGLGLPITKALVELHGGRLEIESTVGEGTQITVHLPYTRIIL